MLQITKKSKEDTEKGQRFEIRNTKYEIEAPPTTLALGWVIRIPH